MSSITLYEYPKCSTCKKAKKWLEAEGISFEAVHIVDTPPDASSLGEWHARSGLDIKKFFNTSGQSYRGGGFKDKLPGMTLEEKLGALAADGKLIKRPLLVSDRAVLVGFKAETYASALKEG